MAAGPGSCLMRNEHILNIDPLIIVYPQDGGLVARLHPRKTDNYQGYALMIADLVRHVALAFRVDEDDVWEWVEKERFQPTTKIRQPS
jgi:hypothetical protein